MQQLKRGILTSLQRLNQSAVVENLRALFRFYKYLFWHKYYVFLKMRELGLGLYQSLIHDYDKIYDPAVIIPYLKIRGGKNYFYRGDDDKLNVAVLRHVHRQPHHWQYWVTFFNGEITPIKIPRRFVLEMFADWTGANLANGGDGNTYDWFFENQRKMRFHPETYNELVELVLKYNSILDRKVYNAEGKIPREL